MAVPREEEILLPRADPGGSHRVHLLRDSFCRELPKFRGREPTRLDFACRPPGVAPGRTIRSVLFIIHRISPLFLSVGMALTVPASYLCGLLTSQIGALRASTLLGVGLNGAGFALRATAGCCGARSEGRQGRRAAVAPAPRRRRHGGEALQHAPPWLRKSEKEKENEMFPCMLLGLSWLRCMFNVRVSQHRRLGSSILLPTSQNGRFLLVSYVCRFYIRCDGALTGR